MDKKTSELGIFFAGNRLSVDISRLPQSADALIPSVHSCPQTGFVTASKTRIIIFYIKIKRIIAKQKQHKLLSG